MSSLFEYYYKILFEQVVTNLLYHYTVLYERCRNCDRKAYQLAKERYEYQRNGLEKKYRAKAVGFDAMIVILWWYASVTTIFAAIRSKAFLSDFAAFVDTVWNGVCQSGKWIVDVGNELAQVGDRIPNETLADCSTLVTDCYSNCWSCSGCRFANSDCRKESFQGVSGELLGFD